MRRDRTKFYDEDAETYSLQHGEVPLSEEVVDGGHEGVHGHEKRVEHKNRVGYWFYNDTPGHERYVYGGGDGWAAYPEDYDDFVNEGYKELKEKLEERTR